MPSDETPSDETPSAVALLELFVTNSICTPFDVTIEPIGGFDLIAWHRQASSCVAKHRREHAEDILLRQFAYLYQAAGIDRSVNFAPRNETVRLYIRSLCKIHCNLSGSNDFHPGVFVYSTGRVVVQCNQKIFELSVLDPRLLRCYYNEVLDFAWQRSALPCAGNRNAYQKSLGFKSLTVLLKEM